ncbi:MAG: gluconate 2-dehydrogenase subunit 3 family protein [Cyclobacteriaceae bacterium]|nr:gluconate 2-dehydrogenase subunit 3 family protein [Cyclobacteriaceae bacterium]
MNQLIDRREALKKTALFLGAAVSASAMAGILNGCKATPDLNYKPVFFNEDEARLVSELADIILPKTDTPGAKELGVPNFIDKMLNECYKKEDQERFKTGLAAFDEDAKKAHGDSFIYCKPEDQVAHITKSLTAAIEERKTNPGAKRPFILMAKELTMLGYFSTQVGAENVLQYEAVPGAYKGCIPLKEAGKGRTWAT